MWAIYRTPTLKQFFYYLKTFDYLLWMIYRWIKLPLNFMVVAPNESNIVITWILTNKVTKLNINKSSKSFLYTLIKDSLLNWLSNWGQENLSLYLSPLNYLIMNLYFFFSLTIQIQEIRTVFYLGDRHEDLVFDIIWMLILKLLKKITLLLFISRSPLATCSWEQMSKF